MNKCPTNTICINNIHVIYISLFLLVGMYLFTNNYIKGIYRSNNVDSINELEERLFKKLKKSNKDNKQLDIDIDIDSKLLRDDSRIINRDLEVLHNPLMPPLKRDHHSTGSYVGRMPINMETRGSGCDYQQVGVLHKVTNNSDEFTDPGNNDKTVILQLFGKPLYKGANTWNYYIMDKNNFKIPLTIGSDNCSDNQRGCKEIYNNDEISIEQYNGTFKVQILKFDAPKYIPYVY